MNPLCIHDRHPIIGKYYKDYWGNTVCASHFTGTLTCSYCGRFISSGTTKGGKSLKDGRVICGICYKTIVVDPIEGKNIMMKTYGELEKSGISIHPFKPDFALIERKDLKRLDRTGREKQGAAVYRRHLRGDAIEKFELQIYILKGLPLVSYISTCAHELMHIWFYSRGITDASPALVEGSCNLASYLILSRMKEAEAAYLIQSFFSDPHRVYGKGFRKMHKLMESRGIPYWLDYISRRKK